MSITTLIIICAAIAGIYFFFPKMPSTAQWIVAIIGAVVCLIVLAKQLGVDIPLHV